MPEPLATLTLGEILAWTVGLSAIAGVIYKIWSPIKAIQTFLRDWSGKPGRKDRAGRMIEEAEPGVLGRLDTMRSDIDRVLQQVENSHKSNFRDDLDKLRDNVEHVKEKVDEHIDISKDHDRYQEDTRQSLNDHIDSTQRWTAMLEDLHERWFDQKPILPPPPYDDQPNTDNDEPR